MRRTVASALALSLAASLGVGCSRNPSVGLATPTSTDDVKPVAPPAEIVGKWRVEVKDGKSTRTSVYHFQKDGGVEVDTRLDSPDLKTTDLVKRAVVKVEKDRVTVLDLSRTADGVETAIPAERRRPRTYQIQVKGDELEWTEITDGNEPDPKSTRTVLKRVKE